MLEHPVSHDALARIVGLRNVLTGEDVTMRNTFWGRESPCMASAIVRPGSTEEIARIMAMCHAARQSVVTHGGLTGLAGGADAEADAIVISTERLSAIETIDPVNRIAIVQAGAKIQQVQEAATSINMSFPVDFGARGSASVGGAISTNAGGNRVFRYGSMREQVLGLEAVLADGTIVSSMRGLVKDNTGYDLKQWFVGAEGTLGIVTRACLRLRSGTTSSVTALLALPSFETVPQLLNRLEAGMGGQLSAFEAMWQSYFTAVAAASGEAAFSDDYPLYILVEALGSDQMQDQARFEAHLMSAMEEGLFSDAIIANSEQQRLKLWAMRDNIECIFAQGQHLDYDISLPTRAMEPYVDDLDRSLKALDAELTLFCFGHVADGNLHVIVSSKSPLGKDLSAQISALVYGPIAQAGGSVSAEHGIGREKLAYIHLSRSPAELHCMALVKAALDPLNLLNPGKIIAPDILSNVLRSR